MEVSSKNSARSSERPSDRKGSSSWSSSPAAYRENHEDDGSYGYHVPKLLFGTMQDNDRSSSDSNSSTDELQSRALPMRMPSTNHLPPRKHRRRTRSSSKRSNKVTNRRLEDTVNPTAARRVPAASSSSSSSHRKRSPSQNIQRPVAQSLGGRTISIVQPKHLECASPDLSSGSSPDSSPSRVVADMYRIQDYSNDTSLDDSRLSLSSKSSLSHGGTDGSFSSSRRHRSYPQKGYKVPTTKLDNNNTSTKNPVRTKFWCFSGSFLGFLLLSLSGIVKLTNRVVMDPNEDLLFTPPHRIEDTGLRGKQVLGRMWDKTSSSIGASPNQNETKEQPASSIDKKTKAKPKDSERKKSKSETTMFPQRLEFHQPPRVSMTAQPMFPVVEPKLYASSTNKTTQSPRPRIVMMDPSWKTPTHRLIEVYPAEFTDNTQLYGVLSSDDERLDKMEMREPYSTRECVPMQDWQTLYQPTCNGVHELPLQTLGASRPQELTQSKKKPLLKGLDATLFGTKGFWRYAWKLAIDHYDHSQTETDTIVFKNLKYEHNFEDAHFEHDRIDAIAMERLTSSPHVINIFGFCGHSVMTEYADGKSLGQLSDKSKKIPLRRLEIAKDIANGLADVHGIDGDGNATFVHLDINPANVVSVNNTLKLNDFNIGIIRQWNVTSQEACGFPTQYPNPQWRSPEEARNEQHLTEKVDIFSLGHIFFRMICGHEPWNKLEPGGRPSKDEVNEKVQRGVLPFIPKAVMESVDPEVVAIRDVMLQCYTFDPNQRPSAREIARSLERTLNELKDGKSKLETS